MLSVGYTEVIKMHTFSGYLEISTHISIIVVIVGAAIF